MSLVRPAHVFFWALILTLMACSTRPTGEGEQSAGPAAAKGMSGLWLVTVESPMGRDEMETRFEQSGDRLSGSMRSGGTDVPLTGRVEGETIRFEMSLEVRGQPLKLEYAGIVQGNGMGGTVQFGPMGMGRFSGIKRVEPPR